LQSSESVEKRRKIDEDAEADDRNIVSEHPAPLKRKLAGQNLNKQAIKMVNRGNGILPPVNVGDNVLVAIPSVDRGRGDAANLLAVIIEEKDKKFRIATKEGVLNTWLERNSMASTKYCSAPAMC
jgi:hypothetical protein